MMSNLATTSRQTPPVANDTGKTWIPLDAVLHAK